MAKYDKTKFYWLQLKEDFFDDDVIEWLENRPNGEKYSNFYLKLCLKSLKTNGILIKRVGNMLIPYNAETLLKLTGVKDIDTVKVAMDLLLKSGIVRVLENGEIYLEQIQEMIGSKSVGALKKEQQRMLGGQKVDNCPPKIDIELDIELEKEIEIDNKKKQKFGNFQRIKLTKEEYERLCDEFGKDFIDNQIQLLDDYVESNNNKNKYSNFNLVLRKSIKENWFAKSIHTKNNGNPPDWFGKDIQKVQATPEEQQEMEDLLKEFR